jgi:2-polyprenyl-6-methoxyphenol hydroxylase-like FAD-dependent oxidoreductase
MRWPNMTAGETPKVLRQALYDREPLPDWQVGRVVLMGDAAHPMMPFYAQGGAQSIEDAYVLAGCIAEAQDRPLDALARFVGMRQPRTAWMQGLARREEELYQMNNAGGDQSAQRSHAHKPDPRDGDVSAGTGTPLQLRRRGRIAQKCLTELRPISAQSRKDAGS